RCAGCKTPRITASARPAITWPGLPRRRRRLAPGRTTGQSEGAARQGTRPGNEEPAMTEAQWLKCNDPPEKQGFLEGRTTERKLRLFNVACCRRIWSITSEEPARSAVEVAERYADDSTTLKDLRAAWKAIFAIWNRLWGPGHTFLRQETVSASMQAAF